MATAPEPAMSDALLWEEDQPEPLERVRFNEAGLVPAIAQDASTGAVLMLAWMNADALATTLRTGWATYFSRSRREIWVKGETSGNRQRVLSIAVDCDGDTLLMTVEPGGPACHTGSTTCFADRELAFRGAAS